jgi:acyl-coenzyme A synthetase/AMP-(fatty) acid ligase
VYPAEVEAALAAHPDVAAVAVVGRPDAFLGEAIVAYLVPQSGAGEGLEGAPEAEELRAFVAARLPSYKVPHAFAWVAELPLGPTGKVLRQALRARDADRI